MARNKHPEETVNLIIDVACRLFIEKGYEHTSIQDIIDKMGGLSKGAIYYHFKSKEDILVAVMDKITGGFEKALSAVRDRTDLTGQEKLKMIYKESLFQPEQDEIFAASPDLSNNPRLLFSMFHGTVKESAPDYILPIIEEGISDGSIQTDYPAELAELIMLITNIWMNPMIFNDSADITYRKSMIFRQIMQSFGLGVVDDEILGRLQELASIYQRNK